jgi:hypothetical protein
MTEPKNIEALAKVLKVNKKEVKRCIIKTSSLSKTSVSHVEDILVWHYILDSLMKGIIKKFGLSTAEKDVLESYIKHVHPESRIEFVLKVYRKDRNHLDQFLDTEFEKFGEDVFEGHDPTEQRQKHKDLYGVKKEDDPTKYTLIYQALLGRLRDMPKEKREDVMKNVFNFTSKTTDRMKRRKEFYDAYKVYLKKLEEEETNTFIDDLFDLGKDVYFPLVHTQ